MGHTTPRPAIQPLSAAMTAPLTSEASADARPPMIFGLGRAHGSRKVGLGAAPAAMHDVSRPLAVPASRKLAMSAGPHPRWPTTCSCAGMTTIRLFGSCDGTAVRFAGGSCGSPSPVNQRIGIVVRTGDASFAGTTPVGR